VRVFLKSSASTQDECYLGARGFILHRIFASKKKRHSPLIEIYIQLLFFYLQKSIDSFFYPLCQNPNQIGPLRPALWDRASWPVFFR